MIRSIPALGSHRTGIAALLTGIGLAGLLSAQTTVTLPEGVGGYTHAGALIRADAPPQNSGVRDQLIVGKTTAAIRATFSFGLSVIPPDAVITGVELDLWTDAQRFMRLKITTP